MRTLADQTLEWLCVLMFAEDGVIDRDSFSSHLESVPDVVAGMTGDEKAELARAASRRLEYAEATSPSEVIADELAFCEALASGALFEQWT